MLRGWMALWLLLVPCARAAQEEAAQDAGQELTIEQALARVRAEIGAQAGPVTGALGQLAHVQVPEGLDWADPAGTQKYLRLTRNIPSETELGSVLALRAERRWFVIFTFEDSGYVKDDERDELDPDAILATIRENQERVNEYRQEQGLEPFEIAGWEKPPFYDPKTNNLTWGLRIRSASGGESINWEVRLLGRSGVMNAQLVLAPEDLKSCLPEFDALLAGFAYDPGLTYGEYREGDKLAEYGLAGLVVGGGAFAAAKLGLFGKLWASLGKLGKLVWVAVAGIAIGIKKLFDKFFRGKGEGGKGEGRSFNQG